MNIKLLAVISLVFLIGAGGFFITQKNNTPKPSLPKPDIVSEISKIKAVQTNPATGEIEYTLTAQSLTQNADGMAILNDVIMDWTPSGTTQTENQERYTIKAVSATLDDKTGDFVFKDGFELIRHATPATNKAMTITGGILIGNHKTKLINSQNPLQIYQDGNEFKAQGFRADLNTQVYDFYNISMLFSAPAHRETPLF